LGDVSHAAHAKIGVIHPRRPGPHQHQIVVEAFEVHPCTGLWSGDPTALAACGGDPAIKACGKLQRHHGPAQTLTGQKAQMRGLCSMCQHARGDLYPGIFEGFVPFARDARVRVGKCVDHACHTCSDQSVGAGRGLAMVGARFQGHVGRGPLSRDTGLGKGLRFAVGPTTGRCDTAPQDAGAVDDHASDRRVGPGLPEISRANGQSQAHPPRVNRLGHSSGSVCSGRSSCTKSSKSSAAWKFL
jgi:hypothetical protein